MSSLKQRRGPAGGNLEAVGLWLVNGLVALVCVFTWIPTHLAAHFDGDPAPTSNPFRLAIDVLRGHVAWTKTATEVATLLALLVVALVVVAVWLPLRRHPQGRGRGSRRGRGGRKRVDRAAGHMGRGTQIAGTGRREAQATADRFDIAGAPGLLVATTVAGRRSVWQDWESVSLDVWGPRAGKSSSRAIPAIMAAPGAVLATSNKRDLLDATRDPRATAGQEHHGKGQGEGNGAGEVWVFDPQQLVDEPVTWWWNPLTYVTDETHAQALAEIFSSAVRKPGARTDAYFDAAALDLIAGLLLAAAAAGRDLTQVYLWLTDPNDDEPAQLLETGGYYLTGAAVRGVVGAPDKQRAGVYGTALQICSFMTNRQAMAWVTDPTISPTTAHPTTAQQATNNVAARVREFDPAAFVRTNGTLYSLSREGRGNAAAIVTALTVAVCEAAEEHAARQPHGRLPVPMVVVLDEAANVCRWPALPDLYSHYGSRGITLLTFLQSWSQGVETWGRDGMRKLWSAATVKVYGGGVSEVEFLEELSRLIGDYQHTDTSVAHSRQGRTTSTSHRTDRILDVADIAALDRGRVIVFASGSVPVLAATTPWWHSPHRDVISDSLEHHDPTTTHAATIDPANDRPDVSAVTRWLA